jgi:two-component system sensor histidine kinase HydH
VLLYPGVNIQSLSALVAAIVTFAIGWSVVLRDRARRSYSHFAVLCFNLCLWHLATFLQATLESEAMYFAALLAAVAIPITSLRFFRVFLADEERATSGARHPRTLTAVAIGFAVAIGYAIVLRKHQLHHAWGFTLPLTVYVFGGLGASMAAIWASYRRTVSRVEKTRLMYLLVGGVVSVTLAATDLLPKVGVSFPAIGNVLVITYMYFLSQTLFRYRLLDLNELLGKMVVLSTFVLILAAIYGLLVAWIPSDQPGVFFFNTLVASFVILILFEPLRAKVEGLVNKWMFREKWELRRRIDDLRYTLANVIDMKEAIRHLIATLEESRRVTHAALYLVDQDASGYELQGHLGPKPVERVDAAARRPFVERLTSVKGGTPLSFEQLEREQQGRSPPGSGDAQNETTDAIARALDEVNAGVCIPIMADDQLLGLLCLKDERLREAYATDEIDIFRALAAQLGITLQNSKLYERMKERDRLAALGEMAAGLAHEIRNPLGAIKGAAQLLVPAPGAADVSGPESREFLGVIVEEVNRLNKVVSQFLDYARPYRGELEPLDVNDVIKKTAQLLQADAKVELSLALDEGLPRVRADAEQLRQVFLNLAINAIQAMPDGGKLTISSALRKARRGEKAQMVEVRFRDTGMGIPPGELKNLFIPFFTTKEKGTGLGLPISQRIVENHGGAIEVRSRLGVGSTFTVVLPAAAVEAKEHEERKAG